MRAPSNAALTIAIPTKTQQQSSSILARGGGKDGKSCGKETCGFDARGQRAAVDLAEKQLIEGTASSQVISHFLKLGSMRAQIEKELLEKQRDLAAAKAESIKSGARMEELYLNAVNAMKSYSGQEEDPDGED